MINILRYESSEISWCEVSYSISIYICEFLNSISGLIYVYHSIKLYNELKMLYSNNFNLKNYEKLPFFERKNLDIIIYSFLIGIFSMYFHGTLSYFGQLLDEYSIYLLVMTLDISKELSFQKKLIGLIAMNIIPKYNRFGLFIYGFYKSIDLLKIFYYDNEQERKKIFLTGNIFFSLGFIIWMIDVFYCDKLVISIHWLWHIFSSYAFYYLSNYVILSHLNKYYQEIHPNYNSYLNYVFQSIPF